MSINLPEGLVYQYIEVNLSRCGLISHAQVEFALPLHSIAEYNASPDAVSISVLKNNSWVSLPTFMLGDKNGQAYYSADTPEFSFFAIIIRNDTHIAPKERFSKGEFPLHNSSIHKLQNTSIPANNSSQVLLASAAQVTQPSNMTFFFVTAGLIGIGTGVFLAKYGWTRYRNRRNE